MTEHTEEAPLGMSALQILPILTWWSDSSKGSLGETGKSQHGTDAAHK